MHIHYSKNIKASEKEFLLWSEPTFVESHRRSPRHDQSEQGIYHNLWNPFRSSAFSLWKGISGQTNQLARSWNTVQSVCPPFSTCLIKNNPPFKILMCILFSTQKSRKWSEQQHVWMAHFKKQIFWYRKENSDTTYQSVVTKNWPINKLNSQEHHLTKCSSGKIL